MSQVVLLAKFLTINKNFCDFLNGLPVFFSSLDHPALFDPALIRGVALDDLQRLVSTSTVLSFHNCFAQCFFYWASTSKLQYH